MTGILAGLIGSFKKAALSWTITSLSPIYNQVYTSATYANLSNGKYFAFGFSSTGGNTSTYRYSTDGTSWSQGTLPASASWRAAATSGSRIIVARGSSTTGYYSDNGTTWTITGTMFSISRSPNQIIYDGTRFIMPAGSNNEIRYSTAGTGTWTSIGTGSNVSGVGYDGSNRHIVTYTASSSTGESTTTFPTGFASITFPSTGIWISPIYGNSIWVAARAGSSSYGTSTNGTTWTSRTLPSNFSETTSDIYAKMIFSDGKFYYYYVDNVYSSTDGINWTTEATVTGGALDNANGWAVGDGKILAFGYASTTSGSADHLIGQ